MFRWYRFLGVIQGISELLPISSTAHMRIVPAVLGWHDPGSAFSAAMQLAALAAVVSYFWRDVTVDSITAVRQRDISSPSFRLGVGIILATIPIGIAGLSLSHVLTACGSPLRSLSVIGYACIGMGVLLVLAEVSCKHRRTVGDMRLCDALIVGLAQVGALIRGASRSGSTRTAALFLNFEREEAARFSFLLGFPAIALAGLKELLVLLHLRMPLETRMLLIFGLVVASISALRSDLGLDEVP